MPQVALSFPAPVGGWNARDPLAAMDPADAVKLINFEIQPALPFVRGIGFTPVEWALV